jgi:hypothetical protein
MSLSYRRLKREVLGLPLLLHMADKDPNCHSRRNRQQRSARLLSESWSSKWRAIASSCGFSYWPSSKGYWRMSTLLVDTYVASIVRRMSLLDDLFE